MSNGLAVRVSVQQGSVLEALSKLFLDPGSKAEVLEDIGFGLAENTRLRFLDQESPDGEPWKPSYRALAQGGETLRDTGALMNSISHLVGPGYVEVGTNLPYAIPLQEGATINAKNKDWLTFRTPMGWARKKTVVIPARPFIGVSQDDAETVIDIINAFLATRGLQ